MHVHLEVTFDTPAVARPRRRRTLVALAAIAFALLLPAAALASHVFSDVPTSHTFHTNIANLAGAGVTAGCGGTKYCPEQPVTRGQMAGFLNRGLGRVAVSDFATTIDNNVGGLLGSVTITPGTSPGALPGAKQFVHVQFTGNIWLNDSTGCPCLRGIYIEGVDADGVSITINTAGSYYPISIGGVIAMPGSGPVTINLSASVGPVGNPAESYTVRGTLVAETIPFGSTGSSAP